MEAPLLPTAIESVEVWTAYLMHLERHLEWKLQVQPCQARVSSHSHVPSPVAGQNFREGVCTVPHPLRPSSAVTRTCILLPPPSIAFADSFSYTTTKCQTVTVNLSCSVSCHTRFHPTTHGQRLIITSRFLPTTYHHSPSRHAGHSCDDPDLT